MKAQGQLLPEQKHFTTVHADTPIQSANEVMFTRDHEVIKQWAARRQAEPATGEATNSGPATVDVNDGGAGIRFNFPGMGLFRPITWDEWFGNFDQHELAFVYEDETPEGTLSNRYRIVKAADWKELLESPTTSD